MSGGIFGLFAGLGKCPSGRAGARRIGSTTPHVRCMSGPMKTANLQDPKPDPKEKARILVVEDHVVVREGFVALINREADLEVCGEADNVSDALRAVGSTRPDLVVVDLVLRQGDGLDLIKAVKAEHPDVFLLVVSMQDEELYAERALRAGASGYVMKQSPAQEFRNAIRAVLAGEIYISPKMNVRLLHRLAAGERPARGAPVDRLTDREIQIYQMIGAGMNTRDIAPHLGISAKTVETHRENIKHKMGLKDGLALIQSATQWVQGRPR